MLKNYPFSVITDVFAQITTVSLIVFIVEIRRPGRLNTVASATITTALELLASESCFAGPSLLLAAAQRGRTRWLARSDLHLLTLSIDRLDPELRDGVLQACVRRRAGLVP